LGVVVVLAQAGVALGGSPLAASERRPTVSVAASSPSTGGGDVMSARLTPSVRGGGHDEGDRLVVVRPGDTLWSIALRFDPDADPRPVVDAMSEARDGAPLVAGETIRWPDAR
jgi:nucleoid-associated protein YgaU